MHIQFDPRDPNACASVLAVIGALHPELNAPAELIDAAQAFDAPSPESAFPPVPFASPAPNAGTAAAAAGFTPTPTSAPVAAEPAPPTAETATAAPAPAPQAAPVASLSSGVELDADGLPWDARIHSGPADKRPKNADGRWRRARGVDDATVEHVTAELRQVMGAPAPAPTPAAAPTPPAPTPPAEPIAAPAPVPASPPPAPVAAAPTPAPAAPAPTPAPAGMESGPAAANPAPSAAPATFADLMKKVTRMQTAGLVTVETTSQIAASLGLTGLRDLMNRPDLVPAFDALLPAEAA